MKNLPFELINYIFSFLNTCIIKNKNNINLRLINKYFKKHTRKCSPGVFFNKHCKYHYKEIFVETDDLSVYKNDNPVLMRIILQK